MKTSLLLPLLFATLVVYGQVQEATRQVSPFESIVLKTSNKTRVYIKEGKSSKLVIKAPASMLAKIESKVANGTLTIRFDTHFWEEEDVEIRVELPVLKKVSLSGGGTVSVEDGNAAANLQTSVTGGGNIEFKEGTKVDNITGAVTGGGTIDAHRVQANAADITVTGGGEVLVYVTGKLSGNITGGGEIYYDGDPAVKSAVTGGGRVSKR